jgi:Ca2+-binding EF-hand superfamily protein
LVFQGLASRGGEVGNISVTKWRYTVDSSDKTRQDFDEIDADGDGYITGSELLVASVKNPKISDDNIVAIIKMADSDGDNKMSYEEYAKFVR